MQNYQVSKHVNGNYMISNRGHNLLLGPNGYDILGFDADYATALAMRDAVLGKLDGLTKGQYRIQGSGAVRVV